jgi:hypothetical protein
VSVVKRMAVNAYSEALYCKAQGIVGTGRTRCVEEAQQRRNVGDDQARSGSDEMVAQLRCNAANYSPGLAYHTFTSRLLHAAWRHVVRDLAIEIHSVSARFSPRETMNDRPRPGARNHRKVETHRSLIVSLVQKF